MVNKTLITLLCIFTICLSVMTIAFIPLNEVKVPIKINGVSSLYDGVDSCMVINYDETKYRKYIKIPYTKDVMPPIKKVDKVYLYYDNGLFDTIESLDKVEVHWKLSETTYCNRIFSDVSIMKEVK